VPISGLNIGGHTVHAKPGNYEGYWIRNSDGVRVSEAVGVNARYCLTSLGVG